MRNFQPISRISETVQDRTNNRNSHALSIGTKIIDLGPWMTSNCCTFKFSWNFALYT